MCSDSINLVCTTVNNIPNFVSVFISTNIAEETGYCFLLKRPIIIISSCQLLTKFHSLFGLYTGVSLKNLHTMRKKMFLSTNRNKQMQNVRQVIRKIKTNNTSF